MGYELKQNDVFDFAHAGNYETRQKGNELEFKYCPYCRGGNHRDEWTFSINLENGAFKCLRASCEKQGHFVELCRDFEYRLDFEPPKIYRQLPQRPIETRDEAVEYMKSRGISEEVTRRYSITVRTDYKNVLVFPFKDPDGHLLGIKYRKTDFKKGRDKNKEWYEKDTMPILFGMDQCKDFTKPLILTEGQIDSLSVAEAGIENAVSVPTGANGFTWFSFSFVWLKQFREIIIFGDCEHGNVTLVDGVSSRLKESGIIIKCVRPQDYLGEKDANDILRRYGPMAVRYAVEHAEVPKLNNVKQLADVKSVDINKLDKIRTGIEELDKVIRGMAMGQLIILTGKRGDGKSTFMSQLVAEALDQNRSVFVYSGELADFHFKRWLNYQLAGSRYLVDYKDQFGETSYYLPDEADAAISEWYRDRAWLYDNNAIVSGTEEEWLPDTIERVIQQHNVQLICIDNLMTAMEKVAEQTNLYLAQSNFVGRLKAIAMKYSVVIILVAHPRKAGKDETLDDNDLVAGSSDITNKADIVIKYSRCDKESYGCDSLIKVTKNRIMGRLRLRNDDAIHVHYADSTKRITGDSYNEQNEKVYGWERFANVMAAKAPDRRAAPSHIEDLEELPF